MTDVADLRINVQSGEVTTAERRLDGLTRAGGKAERATDGLTRSVGAAAAVIAVAAAATAGLAKAISVQREFDVINAGLVTATGSAENAALAFDALQRLAQETPYDLAQVSTAFTQLVNMGLDPSERALMSYGNTASAMGKDLSMLIEAVADAATGEFERLKEFGIKAKSQGDEVALTFRGVTTTVGKNAAEIEDYLIALGENEFAGNMAQRMATLDGAMSNLGDEWDSMFRNIMATDIGAGIEGMVLQSIGALADVNAYLSEGEFELHLQAMGAAFGPWVDDAGRATDIVMGYFVDMNAEIEGENTALMEALQDGWDHWPQYIRAAIQSATVYFAAHVEDLKIRAGTLDDAFAAIFDPNVSLRDVAAQAQAQLDLNEANYKASLESIRQEGLASIMETDKLMAVAARKRAERLAAAQEEPKSVLGQFGLGADPVDTGDDAGKKEAARAEREAEQMAERLRDRFESVRESLLAEEEAMRESYARRRQDILSAPDVGEELRARTLARLDQAHAEDLAREQADRQSARDRLMQDFLTEEELHRQFKDRRIEEQRTAYEQELISWEEFQRNKNLIEEQYAAARAANAQDQAIADMRRWGSMYGALGDLAEQFAQGQSKSAERMFRVSQALNLAQAGMSIAAGIANAQKLEYPMNIVEGIRVAAVGATQIAAISSQRFSGAYDKGGHIPAGSFGVVGERGMEFVEGPANVTGREDTARMLREIAEGGRGSMGAPIVNINVAVDARGNATSTSSVQGDMQNVEDAKKLGQLVDLRVRDVLIKEQRQGGLLSGNR